MVVPPDILNENEPNTLEGGVANEGGNVQLVCQATGVPEPAVQWRRENGKDIVVRTEGREKQGKCPGLGGTVCQIKRKRKQLSPLDFPPLLPSAL